MSAYAPKRTLVNISLPSSFSKRLRYMSLRRRSGKRCLQPTRYARTCMTLPGNLLTPSRNRLHWKNSYACGKEQARRRGKSSAVDPDAPLRHVLSRIADHPINRISDLLLLERRGQAAFLRCIFFNANNAVCWSENMLPRQQVAYKGKLAFKFFGHLPSSLLFNPVPFEHFL